MKPISQIILFCISADLQDRYPEEHSNSRAYQRTLMHNLLSSPTNTRWEQNYRNIIQRGADPQDECQWKGVRCDKGIITHFVCGDFMIPDVYIRMRMFPSTIQFLHLLKTKVHDGWSAETLPRALKYAHIRLDFTHQNKVNFHRLPPNIEEFHGRQEHWHGPIDLTSLPASLEIFQLSGQLHCTPVVDNIHISKNLKRVAMNAWSGSTAKRMESVHGGHLDRKMFKFTDHIGAHLADSKYWKTFHEELRSIWDENQ